MIFIPQTGVVKDFSCICPKFLNEVCKTLWEGSTGVAGGGGCSHLGVGFFFNKHMELVFAPVLFVSLCRTTFKLCLRCISFFCCIKYCTVYMFFVINIIPEVVLLNTCFTMKHSNIS